MKNVKFSLKYSTFCCFLSDWLTPNQANSGVASKFARQIMEGEHNYAILTLANTLKSVKIDICSLFQIL